MSTTEQINIEKAFPWGPAKLINTKNGKRWLSKCDAQDTLVALFVANRRELQGAGVQLGDKWKAQGKEFCWWRKMTADEIVAAQETMEASRATDADIDIPRPEGKNYLGYQRAGVFYALNRFAKAPDEAGVLIGDEMGLGKTIQGIGIINADQSIHRVLIVVPAHLRRNWVKELHNWLTRDLSVGVVEQGCFPTTDIVIISYQSAHKYEKQLSFFWDLVICDEAQYCRNRKAKRTQCVFGYGGNKKKNEDPKPGIPARRRCALTGTPIMNRPADLYPVLKWLDPKTWGSWSRFAARYCGAHWDGYSYSTSGATNEAELNEQLRTTCMVRRLKREVLKDMPPKFRQIIEIDPEGDATALAAIRQEASLLGGRVNAENAESFAKQVNSLAGDTVSFEEIARVRHELGLALVPYAIDHIREAIESVGKVIVFCHHRDVIDAIAAEFPNSVKIYGGMTDNQKDLSVRTFQQDPRCDMIIGNEAMQEGLTLTAASLVISVEPDWVPANNTQREDRAHRIGQTENVTCQYLVMMGTISARILQVTVEKQNVADKVLDKAVNLATGRLADAPQPAEREVNRVASKPVAKWGSGSEQETPPSEQATLAIHKCLKMLAARCDRANELDGAGFNKLDADFGHSMAEALFLTDRQAPYGKRLVRKYHRQLPAELVAEALEEHAKD